MKFINVILRVVCLLSLTSFVAGDCNTETLKTTITSNPNVLNFLLVPSEKNAMQICQNRQDLKDVFTTIETECASEIQGYEFIFDLVEDILCTTDSTTGGHCIVNFLSILPLSKAISMTEGLDLSVLLTTPTFNDVLQMIEMDNLKDICKSTECTNVVIKKVLDLTARVIADDSINNYIDEATLLLKQLCTTDANNAYCLQKELFANNTSNDVIDPTKACTADGELDTCVRSVFSSKMISNPTVDYDTLLEDAEKACNNGVASVYSNIAQFTLKFPNLKNDLTSTEIETVIDAIKADVAYTLLLLKSNVNVQRKGGNEFVVVISAPASLMSNLDQLILSLKPVNTILANVENLLDDFKFNPNLPITDGVGVQDIELAANKGHSVHSTVMHALLISGAAVILG
jgi:hypothetical protein